MNLTISTIGQAVPFDDGRAKGVRYGVAAFSVHPVESDKADGLMFPTCDEAKSAALAWIKSAEKYGKAAMKQADKAMKKAVRQAENATNAVARRAKAAADKLAAEQAKLAEKQARLDGFLQAGTFALVG